MFVAHWTEVHAKESYIKKKKHTSNNFKNIKNIHSTTVSHKKGYYAVLF